MIQRNQTKPRPSFYWIILKSIICNCPKFVILIRTGFQSKHIFDTQEGKDESVQKVKNWVWWCSFHARDSGPAQYVKPHKLKDSNTEPWWTSEKSTKSGLQASCGLLSATVCSLLAFQWFFGWWNVGYTGRKMTRSWKKNNGRGVFTGQAGDFLIITGVAFLAMVWFWESLQGVTYTEMWARRVRHQGACCWV